MVFQFGRLVAQYAKRSVMRRIDGCGGKMYVPRAAYSLSMSFCTVPVIFSGGHPCLSATSWYRSSSIAAVALMVIEVDTRSRGMSWSRISMSSSESIATPTLPTSPFAIGSSES